MNAGKILIIIGAILTLVSTFFLSLYGNYVMFSVYWIEPGQTQANGLVFFFHFAEIFTEAAALGTLYSLDPFWIYISAILLLIWAISGFIQLIGLKKRIGAIIGAILPLFIGIIFILYGFIYLPGFLRTFQTLLQDNELIGGILPYGVPIGNSFLGAYTLVAGGALSLIGGIIGIE
ncbi:MAG: hypothetical protein ACW96X_11890 [Promethearchaeota archaeon]|jgi:hypothetical protein